MSRATPLKIDGWQIYDDGNLIHVKDALGNFITLDLLEDIKKIKNHVRTGD